MCIDLLLSLNFQFFLSIYSHISRSCTPSSLIFHELEDRFQQEILKYFPFYDQSSKMSILYDGWTEILKIQKFRRTVGYTIFFSFSALISYAYNSNTTRAGYSRGDQFYASYPAGSELLTDTTKLYKAALGNCFEEEEWGPIEWAVMSKHFERQGKSPYAYHAQYQAHLASNGHLDGSG